MSADDDLIVLAQPQVDGCVDRVRAVAPDARIEIVEPGAALGPEPRQANVIFADQPPADIAELDRLSWVQLGSHGYGQLAGLRLPEDAVVTNASGVQDAPIAQWCLMMMLAQWRDLAGMSRAQREHRWDRSEAFQRELSGLRVGILGFGNIARELTRVCQALRMQVWAAARSRTHDRGLRYDGFGGTSTVQVEPDRFFGIDELPEFLSGLDFFVITVPATSGTRGMITGEHLAALPRHAFLLNPARAAVVDEAALLAALQDGTIAGAALDDHYRQPMPSDDPFWDAPNTIISAHVSGSNGSPHYRERIWELFTENLRRWRAGEPLVNVIARADLDLAPGSSRGPAEGVGAANGQVPPHNDG